MKVRIEIDTKTFVRFWLVVIGFVLGILAIYSARDALIVVGAAFFLALALNAPVNYLAQHIPGKSRVLGTALAFIVVVLVLGVAIFLVIPPIAEQTNKFINTFPSLVNEVSHQWNGVNELIVRYNLQEHVIGVQESIKNSATGWATDFGTNVVAGVGSVLSTVVTTFLVLVLSFLMLIEGPDWLRRLWGLYNNKARMEAHRNVTHRMYQMVTGFVTGQLTVSLIGSSLAGVAVFILSLFMDVPSNLAIPAAAITFTLSLIPMFGATISGIVVSLLLAFNDFSAGIIFAIYFIIYQQIENNFISPVIQSRRVELSALAVLVSVTIGLYLFGLAGGIISIPIAACLKVLLEDYLDRAQKNRETPGRHKKHGDLAKKLTKEKDPAKA